MNADAREHPLRAVVGAFAFLLTRSLANRVMQRLRRLRQPKYLIGSLVAIAYFYFVFFHRAGAPTGAFVKAAPAVAAGWTTVVAFGLLVSTLGYWVFAGASARLAFTQTEIAFLFPAPLTRTTLIHFSLLRAQLRLVLLSLLMGVLFRRGSALGAGTLQFSLAYWLLFSITEMHTLAASFTRQRLLDLGVRPWLRRMVVAVFALTALLACGWALRGKVHWPPAAIWAGGTPALLQWFDGILATAPLNWLLTPFRWVVAPMFAPDAATFARDLLPALALLVAHYVWALRAQVSFEDASLAHARRRTEKIAAMRAGRLSERAPTQPRREPFALAGQGFAPLAFLWKGLIALGPMYRLRNWLIACGIVVALCQWLAADPLRRPILTVVGIMLTAMGGWLLVLGPMMVQRGMRRTLEQMDILKAAPLRGWQIALGELLSPAAVMTCLAWLLLVIGVEALAHSPERSLRAPPDIAAAAFGAALIVPPLCAFMLSLPFAGLLYFPAWAGDTGQAARGFEAMGARLIFMGGYVLVLALSLLPVALIGALGFWLGERFIGLAAGLLLAALLACAGLVLEVVFSIDLLGRRIDGFDVSQELS
ncbi:MAG: hypothetical protein JSS44_13800 [Proteobacteria bacterium]|nr:hypothetical protein [Pseudomonadota bacterium]